MLYLSDADVNALMPMADCLRVIEEMFVQQGEGLVENKPRQRLQVKHGNHRLMMGVAQGSNAFGLKSYAVARPGGMRYLVLLHDLETGTLVAIVEAKRLGELRTGAAAGVATKYLARADAATIGIIGTGREARAQIDAMCGVRKIRSVKAYSRTGERRETFAKEMSAKHGIEVTPVESGEETVRGADIVITITSTNTPVLEGAWLEPGQHVNAIGATSLLRRELDEAAVGRADRIVVESLEQAKDECGELIYAVERGLMRWGRVVELADVIAGKEPGRTSAGQVTLFDSLGVASEDVASAAYVLQRARERGIGIDLPIPETAV